MRALLPLLVLLACRPSIEGARCFVDSTCPSIPELQYCTQACRCENPPDGGFTTSPPLPCSGVVLATTILASDATDVSISDDGLTLAVTRGSSYSLYRRQTDGGWDNVRNRPGGRSVDLSLNGERVGYVSAVGAQTEDARIGSSDTSPLQSGYATPNAEGIWLGGTGDIVVVQGRSVQAFGTYPRVYDGGVSKVLALSASGQTMVAVDARGVPSRHDVQTGQSQPVLLPLGSTQLLLAAVSENNVQVLVTAGSSSGQRGTYVYRVWTEAEVFQTPAAATAIALSSNGKLLAVGMSTQGAERRIAVYDGSRGSFVPAGFLAAPADVQPRFGQRLDISGDGKTLVTTDEGHVYVYENLR